MISEHSEGQSDGSGYVLAVESPYLYVSGGHHIEMLQPNLETGKLDVFEGARVELTETTVKPIEVVHEMNL